MSGSEGRSLKQAVRVGVVVLLVGSLLAAVDAPPFTRDAEEACPGYTGREGTSYHTEPAWPLGAVRCTYSQPGGGTRQVTSVPWFAWGTVAALAVGIGAGWLAIRSRRHRRRAGGITVLLALGSGAAWFAGSVLVLVVVAVLAALLAAGPLRGGEPRRRMQGIR